MYAVGVYAAVQTTMSSASSEILAQLLPNSVEKQISLVMCRSVGLDSLLDAIDESMKLPHSEAEGSEQAVSQKEASIAKMQFKRAMLSVCSQTLDTGHQLHFKLQNSNGTPSITIEARRHGLGSTPATAQVSGNHICEMLADVYLGVHQEGVSETLQTSIKFNVPKVIRQLPEGPHDRISEDPTSPAESQITKGPELAKKTESAGHLCAKCVIQ